MNERFIFINISVFIQIMLRTFSIKVIICANDIYKIIHDSTFVIQILLAGKRIFFIVTIIKFSQKHLGCFIQKCQLLIICVNFIFYRPIFYSKTINVSQQVCHKIRIFLIHEIFKIFQTKFCGVIIFIDNCNKIEALLKSSSILK